MVNRRSTGLAALVLTGLGSPAAPAGTLTIGSSAAPRVSTPMAVVRHMCDDIVVLYRGKIVEQGSASQVRGQPAHPYTRRLLAAVPTLKH